MAEARPCELNERSAGIHQDEEKGENWGKKATARRAPGGCRDSPATLQVPESRSVGRNTVHSSPDLAEGTDLHMREPNGMKTNATPHVIELLDTTARETQPDRMTHYDLPSSTWQGTPRPKPRWTSIREEKKPRWTEGTQGQTHGTQILHPAEMPFRNEGTPRKHQSPAEPPRKRATGHSPNRREDELGSAEKPTSGESGSEHTPHHW